MTQVSGYQRRHQAPLKFLPQVLLTLVLTVPPFIPMMVAAGELPPISESRPASGRQYADSDVLSLADRIARIEELLEGQMLVDMLMRIETLQTEVQELRGLSEVYAHEVEGMKKRQRDLYLDIDRRLRQLLTTPGSGQGIGQESSSPADLAAQAAQGVPSVVASGNSGKSQAAVNPRAEQAAYRQAFDVLKEGRYEDSIKVFAQFYKQYPNGQYADNAIYWIGEANYVLRRFLAAIKSFNRVLTQFPDSTKIADTMLKIGFSHYELQAWVKARKSLDELIRRFPTATAAQLAKNRLHKMKVEGH